MPRNSARDTAGPSTLKRINARGPYAWCYRIRNKLYLTVRDYPNSFHRARDPATDLINKASDTTRVAMIFSFALIFLFICMC